MIYQKEGQSFVSLSTEDIRKKLINSKEQYKIAKENYEFETASLLLDDIKYLQKELRDRAG